MTLNLLVEIFEALIFVPDREIELYSPARIKEFLDEDKK